MKRVKKWKAGDVDNNSTLVQFGARFDVDLQVMLRAVSLLSPQRADDLAELNRFTQAHAGPSARTSWDRHLEHCAQLRQQYLEMLKQQTETALARRDGSWFRRLADLLDDGDQTDRARQALMVWAGFDGDGNQTVFLTTREITDRLWKMGEEVDERHVRRLCRELGVLLRGNAGRPRKSDKLKSRAS